MMFLLQQGQFGRTLLEVAGAAPTTTLLDFDEYAEDDVVSGVQHGITHNNVYISLTSYISGWTGASSPNYAAEEPSGTTGLVSFETSTPITAASFDLTLASATFLVRAYTAGGSLVNDSGSITAGAQIYTTRSLSWTAGQNVQKIEMVAPTNSWAIDNLSITQV